MRNPLLDLGTGTKFPRGMPSFCCANSLVIEALLENSPGGAVLIEGTANQINQFGGYTGMTPSDFHDYVCAIADRTGFSRERLILGGDHMGPLVWADLPAEEAMKNARDLVRLCVLAGFKKIHLDTSMRLGDDPRTERLSDDTIAERGAELLAECEAAYQELLCDNPNEMRPVYVIGSEVPIPGGAQTDETLTVTGACDFENTLTAYQRKFKEYGLEARLGDVIAVVVQPGVEFSEKGIHPYNRVEAAELCGALKQHGGVVFEGHSTDYQPQEKLREMVQDGISILKVGPALTFALREGLFALSFMEAELLPEVQRARFPEVLESAMLANPKNWKKYYCENGAEARLERRFSFSDRSRYYLNLPEAQAAIEKLFQNIDGADVPLGMLSQYMPKQYKRVRDGILPFKARNLVKDCVAAVEEVYNAACYE